MSRKTARRVALHLRVSTSEQTTENQRRELQAVADKAGWEVVAVFEDAGISGAKGREQRPGYDAMLKAVTRREVDMVAAWSVDRQGRSMADRVAFLGELHARGADLYLHQQALDTTTPSGRAMIRERVNAGLARAKAEGKKLGRPTVGAEIEARIKELLAQGMGMLKLAKTLGVGVSAVQRVVGEGATVSPVTAHNRSVRHSPTVLED